MNGRYLTISVDDGYPADRKVADLLQKYRLQATFYVPARNPEHRTMQPNQIRELSREFEIGSHTYNHVALKSLPGNQAWAEIYDGKKWLEDVLGAPVSSFCYPRGKFNAHTVALVKKAGFVGARTCLFNVHEPPRNAFLWGVTTHAYCHSIQIQIRHALLEGNLAGLKNFFQIYKAAKDWQSHFLLGLDYVEKYGGVAHLYLHSWEIEELGEWKKLELALESAAARKLTALNNADIFRLWPKLREPNEMSTQL